MCQAPTGASFLSTEDNNICPEPSSRLGLRLDRILSLAIHISPNNGVINTVQSGKLVVNVLAMHCAH